MPPDVAVGVVVLSSYLIGAIPFGYLLGLAHGVNLFRVGSGNIGATNVTRTLGIRIGILCFLLDFGKGAGTVAACVGAANALSANASLRLGDENTLRVLVATVAFLGHLFPIYLGFRGGKGVATGAGVISVLVPGPAAMAVFAWLLIVLASRYVSLASVAAVIALSLSRLLLHPNPFSADNRVVSLFVLIGSFVVLWKHRSNITRLVAGTENRIGDFPMRQTLLRALHIFALGVWVGGAGFFNFTAPTVFASFKTVVETAPSDRTAQVTIIPHDAPVESKNALARALAGSSVGPLFPIYFAMQFTCGVIALVPALMWWFAEPRRIHAVRAGVIGAALLTVMIGWPISQHVSGLRLEQFSADVAIATHAKEAFGPWHTVSLLLSFVSILLASIGLLLAAKLPQETTQPAAEKLPQPVVS